MRFAVLATLVLGCGAGVPAAKLGKERFSDVKLSVSPFNTFSCATCHQVRADPAARIDPGYDLHDAVRRPSWWGGYVTRVLDAVNQCFVDFMGGSAMDEDDDRARTLYEYLLSESSGAPAEARPLTVVKDITALSNLTGDAAAGQGVYDRACLRCHGASGTGEGRLSTRISIIPNDTVTSFGKAARAVTVEKVRHGRYFNVGGVMPLYSVEAISDQQIGDVLTFMGL